MSSRSGSSRRKAHVAVRLRDSNKDDDNDDDAAELSGSDNDNKEEGSDEAVPELPEGTVIVNPEPVDDSDESKSSRNSRRSNQTSSFSSSSTLLERVCCTSCNKQMNPHNEGAIRRHKLLKVLQCKKCYKYLKSGEITQDEDGLDEQCCWCGEGGRLYGCDFCHHTFCRACIMRNFGRAEATKLEADGGKWKCYICDRSKIAEKREYGNKVLDMIEKIQQKERERERAARRKAKAAASKEGTPASSDKNSSSASNQKEKEKGASRKSLPAPVKSLPAPVKLKSAAIINDGSRNDNQVLVVKQNPHPPNPVNLVSKTLYQPVQSRAITAHKMILPKPTLSSDILMAHMQRPYNPAMHRPVEQMPMVSLEQMQGRSNNSSPTPFGADVPKNNTEQLKKNVNQGNVAEMVDKMKTVSASLSLMLNSISTDLEICQLQRQNMRLAKEKACLSLRDGIDGLFSNVREIFNVSISATTDGVAAATNGKDSKVSLVSSSTPIGKKEAIIHPSPIKNGNLDVSCIPICIDDDSDSDSNSRKVGETETKEVTLKDSVKAEPMEDMANPGKTEEATVKGEGNKSDSDVEMKNEEESDIEAERDSVDSKSKLSMKKEAEKSISVKERDESEDEDNEDNNDADGNDDNDENSDGVNNDDDDGGEDGGDHPMDVDDEPQERKDKDKKDSARPRRSNRSADSKRDSEDVLSDDDDSKGKGSLRSKKGKGEKKKGSETTPKSKDKHRTEKEKKSKKSAQEKEEDSDCETEKTKTKSSSRKKSNREKRKKENVTDEEEDSDCETEKTKTKSSSRKQSNREKSKKENVTDEEEDSDCKTEKTQTKSSSRKKSKEKSKKENVTDEEGDSDCETEKTKTKSSSRKKSKEKSKKENVTDEEDDSECETEKTKTKSTSPKKSKEKSKKENVTGEEDDSECETEKTKTKSSSRKKSKEKSKMENITDEDEGSDSGNKKKDKEDEEIEEEVSKPKALSKSKSVDSENVAAQLELLKEMADELSEMNRKNEEEEGDGKDDDKGDVEENGDDDVGDDMDDDVEDNIDDDLEEKEDVEENNDVEENEDEDVEENKDVDVENKDVAESDSDTKVTKGKGKGKKSKVSAKESKSGKKGKAKDADESKDKTEKESKKKKKKSVEESTDEKSSKGKTKKEPADEKKKGQKNDQDNSSSSSDDDDDTDSSDEDVTRKRRKPRKTSSKKEKEPAVKKERAVKKEQKKRSSKRNAAKEESIKVQTESDSENFDSDLEKDIKTLEKDTRVQKSKSKKGEKESTKKSSSKEKEKKKSKKKGKDDDESLSSGTDKENEDEAAEDEEQDDDDKTEDEDYTEKIKKLKESEKKDDQEEDMEEDESEDNDDNADEEEDDDTDEVSFPKLALAKKGKKKAASDVSGSDSDPAPKKKKISNNLLDAKLSDSDSDFQTPKKKRKRPDKERGKRKRKHSSDESEEEEKEEEDDEDEEDDEEDEESESGSGSGSGSDGGKKKKKKKKKKGKGKRSYAKSKGKKRRRIKKMESSEDEKERGEGDVLSGDEEEEDEDDETTPGGGFMKRKKIRKVQKNKKLTDETKAARKAEEERRKRIEERQKEFNSYVEVEAQVDEEELPEGVEREAASTDAVNNFQGPHKKVPVTTKLILEKDKEKKKDLIMVDSTLIKKLKPHQVDAVRFMYNCLVESLDRIDETGAGCILAHCMGLGKTLSVISFVHTMTKHRKLTKLSKVVVVCPLNTVLNWVNEFEIWQDDLDFQMDVYELSSVKENFRRARMLEDWHKGGPGALIIGYDMYRNLTMGSHCKNKKQKKIFYETLCDPGPDIVICDEGHILKNDATSVSKAMNKVRSRRRVVLTGTPLQNNLGEYHCMVDFVKPNLLGTRKEFGNRFVNPITNGQCRDSTGFDVKLMKRRAHILHEMLAGCVQRKDYSALTKFLPPKMEYVVSVRLSKVQMQLYEKYMELSGLGAFRDISSKGARLFKDYQALMRIWTHPWVLHLDKVRQDNKVKYDDSEDSFIDDISGNETDESFFSGKSSPEVSAVEISDSDDEKRGRRRRRSSSSSGSDDDKKKAKSEIVKKWKTRSRGTDENGAGPSWADDPIIVEDDNNVGTEWWHEFVSKGDERRLEIGGKMVLLFEILKMCEEIGDKVLVFSQSLLSLDIIEDFLEKIDSVHSMADEVKKEEGKENSAGDEKSTDDKADKKDSDVTGDKKEEGSGDKIDDGSGDKKDDGSGDKKEDGSADKKEDGSADKKEDVSADKKEDGSADKKEDGSADKKDDGSADKKEDGSADKKEDGSADKKEDGSADKPAEPEDPLLRYRSSWTRGADYFRMDGSTSVQNRKAAQNMFNDEENYRARLFLISTKAGSLGINLVSANRVIIFDASWNPSHDIQSIFRVYRFGQVKPVYVYRFLAQGTMEEKIYERQVTKQSLSQRVIDEHQIERHFTSSDLQELYKFQPDRLDDPDRQPKPLPMLPKDHMLAELVSSHKEWLVTFHEHDSLLENIVGEELSEEDRKAAWEEYENEKKGLITNKVNPMMSIISNPNMGGQMYGNMGMMGGNMHMQQSNNPMMGLSQAAVMQIVQDLKMRFPNLPQDMFEQRVQAVLRQVLTQQMINQNDYQRNLERRQMEELQRLNQLKQQIQRQQNQVDAQQRGLGLSSQFSNSRMTNPSVQMQLEQARQRAAAGQKMDGRSNPKS